MEDMLALRGEQSHFKGTKGIYQPLFLNLAQQSPVWLAAVLYSQAFYIFTEYVGLPEILWRWLGYKIVSEGRRWRRRGGDRDETSWPLQVKSMAGLTKTILVLWPRNVVKYVNTVYLKWATVDTVQNRRIFIFLPIYLIYNLHLSQ